MHYKTCKKRGGGFTIGLQNKGQGNNKLSNLTCLFVSAWALSNRYVE